MGVRGLDNKDISYLWLYFFEHGSERSRQQGYLLPVTIFLSLNMGVRGLDNKDINPTCDYIPLNMGVRGLDNKDISYLWLYFFEHGSERSRQQGY